MKTKIILASFILVIILIIVGILFVSKSDSSCQTDSVTEMNIGEHKNLALHIHPNLKIIIDGKEQIIPANIGIGSNLMRPLHTHDSSGKIHIEALCQREFKLREFFEIWDKEFSNDCIFDYCVDNGSLKMYVNGKENLEFENYFMQDKDQIHIEYTSIAGE